MADTREENLVDPSEWVDQYGDYLYKYALLRLKDPVSAKDVVQETFMAGIKGLDRFDGRVQIRFWLRGILRNKIVDHINKQARETPVEDLAEMDLTDSFSFKAFGVPPESEPWHFNARKSFEQKEFWAVFRDCVDRLKGPMQKAFTLTLLEGVPTEEVCKILDITPNNLWVMTHRARQQLRTCLQKNWVEKTT